MIKVNNQATSEKFQPLIRIINEIMKADRNE